MINNSVDLTGRLVAVRERNSHVLIPAKAISKDGDNYTVEFAAGNTKTVSYQLISVSPAWLAAKWNEMRG